MKKKLILACGVVLGILALVVAGYLATNARTEQGSLQSSDLSVSYTTLTSSLEANDQGIEPIQSDDPCPGSLTCQTYMCGGTDKNPYVCCPSGYPYLNHCDCKCYDSSDFPCGSYSYCRQW